MQQLAKKLRLYTAHQNIPSLFPSSVTIYKIWHCIYP